MFIAVLFTVSRVWKQPNCSQYTTGQGTCGTYIQWHIMKPHKERNLSIFDSMDGSRGITLSEISQTEKDKY